MSTIYQTQDSRIKVEVSIYAKHLIGAQRMPEFMKLLTEIMDALGCDWAYVGKAGPAVAIYIHHKNGWTGTIKLEPGK